MKKIFFVILFLMITGVSLSQTVIPKNTIHLKIPGDGGGSKFSVMIYYNPSDGNYYYYNPTTQQSAANALLQDIYEKSDTSLTRLTSMVVKFVELLSKDTTWFSRKIHSIDNFPLSYQITSIPIDSIAARISRILVAQNNIRALTSNDKITAYVKDGSGNNFNSSNPLLTSNISGFRDTVITVTIDSLGSLSSAINLGNRRLKTIYMPAAWTTANLTYQISDVGSSYYNFYSDDIEMNTTAAASYGINVNPRVFVGIQYLKIRSGTSGTPVSQTGTRQIKIKIGNY